MFQKVKPEVDLMLLDHDFFYGDDEHKLHETSVIVRRPDWVDLVIERMITSQRVFLFDRHWYQVSYHNQDRRF